MPPKKRKAPSSPTPDGFGEGEAATPPKKSKKARLMEAKEKARQWHLAKKKKEGGSSAAAPKAPAVATTPAAATKTKASKPAAPRIRKSMGVGRPATETKPTPVARNRRSSTGSARPTVDTAVATTGDEGTPIRSPAYAAKIKASGRVDAKIAATSRVDDTSEDSEDDVPESERVKKPPAMTKKQKREEAREKAKSWHTKRKSLPANGQVLAKADEEDDDEEGTEDEEDTEDVMDEDDSPTISEPVVSPAPSAEKKRPEPPTVSEPAKHRAKISSPDPPSSAFAYSSAATDRKIPALDPPSSLSALVAAAASAPRASTSGSNGRSAPPTAPPAAVASLFAPPKSPKGEKEKFDPNHPWPPKGHKLPAAGHGGCGPTPSCLRNGSGAVAVASHPFSGTETVADPSAQVLQTSGDGGDGRDMHTASNLVLEGITVAAVPSYGHCTPSPATKYGMPTGWNPPDRKPSPKVQDDGAEEKKMPARPCPPPAGGNEAPGIALRMKAEGAGFGKTMPPPVASASATAEIRRRFAAMDPPPSAPVSTAAETPMNTPAKPAAHGGNLSASIRNASALMASVGRSNVGRREAMGIRGDVPAAGDGGLKMNEPPVVAHPELRQLRSGDPPASISSPGGAADEVHDEAHAEPRPTEDELEKEYEKLNQEMLAEEEIDGQESVKELSDEDAKDEPKPSKTMKFFKKFFTLVYFLMLVQTFHGLSYVALHNMKGEPRTIPWGDGQELRLWPDFIPPFYNTSRLMEAASRLMESGDGETEAAEEKKKAVKCFMNYPSTFDAADEDMTSGTVQCAGDLHHCPLWGRCYGGTLRDCLDGVGGDGGGEKMLRFVPNDAKDGCVLTSDVVELVSIVQESLTNMTIIQTCDNVVNIGEENVARLEGDKVPLFSLNAVATKVNNRFGAALEDAKKTIMTPQLLLWLYPAFDVEIVRFGTSTVSGDGRGALNAMGLTPRYTAKDLDIPWLCSAELMAWEAARILGECTLSLTKMSAVFLWNFCKSHPLFSIGVLFAVLIARWLRRKLRHRKRVRALANLIHDMALDRLAGCDDGEGYGMLHVRDDICDELYRDDNKARFFMNEYAWPRVLIKIRSDNRISKSRKVLGGKDMEHWEMISIPAKRALRRRQTMDAAHASTGSLNRDASTGSLNRDAPEEEGTNTGSDPP